MSQTILESRGLCGIGALLLASFCLACGGTTTESEGEGTGGTGGGVGGTGGASTTGCQEIIGAYEIEVEGYAGPWLLIQDTSEQGCTAIVANNGHPARRYDVSLSGDEAVLTPVGEPAIEGQKGLTSHHLREWNEIQLDLEQGGLAGTASADTVYDWNEEDIWGEEDQTLDALTVKAATPGTVEIRGPMLPWREATVRASRPTSSISAHVEGPSADWVVEDDVIAEAEGIIAAEVRFSGAWDDVRGQTIPFTVSTDLADLSGASISPAEAEGVMLSVLDIGPAIPAHDMTDTTSLATWGSVEPFEEGDCATSGCLRIQGSCGSYAGIAGQLQTDGATEVVLSMQLNGYDTYVDTPAFSVVEVIAEDGTELTPKSGGSWDSEQTEQTWVYDVSGFDTVGFAIEASSYCHGWGGPIIVDSVRAE